MGCKGSRVQIPPFRRIRKTRRVSRPEIGRDPQNHSHSASASLGVVGDFGTNPAVPTSKTTGVSKPHSGEANSIVVLRTPPSSGGVCNRRVSRPKSGGILKLSAAHRKRSPDNFEQIPFTSPKFAPANVIGACLTKFAFQNVVRPFRLRFIQPAEVLFSERRRVVPTPEAKKGLAAMGSPSVFPLRSRRPVGQIDNLSNVSAAGRNSDDSPLPNRKSTRRLTCALLLKSESRVGTTACLRLRRRDAGLDMPSNLPRGCCSRHRSAFHRPVSSCTGRGRSH